MLEWILPEWITVPEWLDMTQWLEPKLILLIALIATVLWLSNLGASERARHERHRQGRAAAMLRDLRR